MLICCCNAARPDQLTIGDGNSSRISADLGKHHRSTRPAFGPTYLMVRAGAGVASTARLAYICNDINNFRGSTLWAGLPDASMIVRFKCAHRRSFFVPSMTGARGRPIYRDGPRPSAALSRSAWPMHPVAKPYVPKPPQGLRRWPAINSTASKTSRLLSRNGQPAKAGCSKGRRNFRILTGRSRRADF